ncbi:MAG: HD domain-containing protein [Spirochaetales bacterium]|nr:HD domain-containing protein [Spirochaetales bacterium]
MNFRLGSKILYFKLISLFVLYGVIVSYVSFLSVTAVGTYKLYRSFRDGMDQQLEDLMHSQKPDVLYRAFVEEPALGQSIITNLKGLIPENQSRNIDLALYSRHPNNNLWVMLASVNRPEEELALTPKTINDLNNTAEAKRFYRPEVYLGQEDHRVFYIDMTSERDTLSYVFAISLKREGFAKFVESEKSSFITFTTIILVFSLVLGALFAKSISRPIKNLTDKALILARGEMGIRFHSRRLDDIGSLARSLDRMSLNLNHRFNSMQTMNKIDRAVLSSVSRSELLEQVAGFISDQFDKTTVAVLGRKEEGIVITALVPEREHTIDRLIFYSDLPEEFQNLKETLVLDLEKARKKFQKNTILFPVEQKKRYGVIIPIFHNEHCVAIFAISLDTVSEQDKEALEMLADQVGVALRSKIEMEQREELTQGTLLALTRTVDAKSKWTAGHTERVARLSAALARELGLTGDDLQRVRVAALLHDIGKLGIPESILDKPGKLTDEEFDLIKSHPEKGDTIIKDIPGMYDVRKGVRHHHERWDGNGYPDRLAGEEIPLIARIITLADVCDAISEDRPYREGFSREEAYSFLEDQRGSLFDPDLLDVFLRVISADDSPL